MHNPFVYPSSDTLSRSSCIIFAASSKVSLAQASPHLSLLHSVINTSLHSSFFSLFWSGPSPCFVSWDLLYFSLLWTKFCALEFAIASLLQHKQNKPTKLAPQSHLCKDPSVVPLKALDTCFSLQALCIQNLCAGSVIKTLIQEHRQVQHKACCWHSAEKHNPINHRSRRPLCLPTCRQQHTLTKFQVSVHFAYSETWTLASL